MAGISVPQYEIFKIGTNKLKYSNWDLQITKEDASLLEEKYEVCDTRALKGGIKVNVVKMCDNFIVLDTR